MRMRQIGTSIVVVLLIGSMTGCAFFNRNKPPILTPEANTAWNRTQVIRSVDLVRDVAITASEFGQKPFTPAATRAIVQGHQSILVVMRSTQDGWEAAVSSGLDETLKNIPKDVAGQIAPYIALTKALFNTIVNRGIDEDSAAVIAAYKKALETSLGVDERYLSSH